MNDFFIRVTQQLEQQLPFVIFSKPDSGQVCGLFQKNDHLYFVEHFGETGFVFAPFDGNRLVLFPENESESGSTILAAANEPKTVETAHTVDQKAQSDFENLVSKGIEAIGKGYFGKVVLSRKEVVEMADFDTVSVFRKLASTYPSAFTYCWFHPKIGMWLGATPEKLLKADGTKFYSVALAGTQKFEGTTDVVWENKEKDEQQFVTDFILESLKNVAKEMVVSSPYTAQAGNLLHIKTDIEGVLNDPSDLGKVISVLHPTPAVCGLPKLTAKDFILENEGYNREYYTGFLGELNRNCTTGKNETDLFVNLRCMQIRNNQAHLYIGCGITKDSIPKNEFIETVNKSMTMKKVLL